MLMLERIILSFVVCQEDYTFETANVLDASDEAWRVPKLDTLLPS